LGGSCGPKTTPRKSWLRPRCTTSPSTRFLGSRRTHPMDTSSLVLDQARQLTAAGQHAEVVNYLAARQGSELVESASLALLYGTAQARAGRHAEGLRGLVPGLGQAPKGGGGGVGGPAGNARGAMALA